VAVALVGRSNIATATTGTLTASTTARSGTIPRTALHLLVVVVNAICSTSVTAITQSGGSDWTKVAGEASSTITRTAVFWKVALGSDAAPAFTSTRTGSYPSMQCVLYELSGTDLVAPVITYGIANAAGAIATLNTLANVPNGNCYALGGHAVYTGSNATDAWTKAANWTADTTDAATARFHHSWDILAAPTSGAVLSFLGTWATAGTAQTGMEVVIADPYNAKTTPAKLDSPVAFPVPVVRQDARATPAVLDCHAAFPAATAHVDATASPAVLSAPCSFPQPTVTTPTAAGPAIAEWVPRSTDQGNPVRFTFSQPPAEGDVLVAFIGVNYTQTATPWTGAGTWERLFRATDSAVVDGIECWAYTAQAGDTATTVWDFTVPASWRGGVAYRLTGVTLAGVQYAAAGGNGLSPVPTPPVTPALLRMLALAAYTGDNASRTVTSMGAGWQADKATEGGGYVGTYSGHRTSLTADLATAISASFTMDANPGNDAAGIVLFAPVVGAYDDEVAADSPTAYWKLDDANGASTVADSAGSYPGTPSGVTLGVADAPAGMGGTCAAFTANSNVINATGLNPSWPGLTAECWINFNGTGPVNWPIAMSTCPDNADPSNGWILWSRQLANNGCVLAASTAGTSGSEVFTTTPGPVMPVTGWHHLVGTYDGSYLRLYLDGVLYGSPVALTGSITPSPADRQNRCVVLGQGQNTPYDSALQFLGRMRGAAVYDHALAADRIATHYNAGVTASGGGADATATPAVLAAPASFPAPAAHASSTATPAVLACPAAFPAPTARAGITASPAVLAAPCSFPAPAASSSSTASPAKLAAPCSFPQPAVTTAQDATASPAVLAAPASFPAPAVSASSTASPAVLAVPCVFPAPAASAGTRATPAVLSAPVAFPAPLVHQDAWPSPAVLAAPASVPLPTVTAGGSATASPLVLACPVSFGTPLVRQDQLASPAVLAAPASLPAAAAHASSTASPAALAAPAAFPAPAVSTGMRASPAALAAPASFPAPAAHSGAQASPATLAAPCSFPAPTVRQDTAAAPSSLAAPAWTGLPVVTAGGGATVTASTLSCPVSFGLPVVRQDALAAPATLAAPASLPAATARAGVTASPLVLTTLASFPPPVVRQDARPAPAVLAAPVTFPVVIASASATASPSRLAVPVAFGAPVLSAGQTAFPAVLLAPSSFPPPWVTSGSQYVTGTVTWALHTAPRRWKTEAAPRRWSAMGVPRRWRAIAAARRWAPHAAPLRWRIIMDVFEPIWHGSLECVNVRWTAELDGTTIDPTQGAPPATVRMAFPVSSGDPDNPAQPVTWYDGTWLAGGTGKGFIAQCLVGPSGATQLAAGSYDVWCEVQGAPEAPRRFAGVQRVL
jgi:Concanavalin A-like lectin/glucanases superfamily